MAYTIQQRRDTKDNWEKVNPVLADAEIGFIKDVDNDGKSKSSLFKIGDGKTAWIDLPLFGWGGTFYNADSAWRGSDLDTSIASQQAVLNKIAEKILASETTTNATIEEVRAALEESFNASIAELDKKYDEIINGTAEYTDEDSGEVIPATPGIEGRLANTEGKIDILLGDNTVEGSIDNRVKDAVDNAVSGILDGVSIDFDTLKEVETYITSDKAAMKSLNELTEGHTATLESHTASIEKHEKDIYGWDEEVETEETDPETGDPIKETVHHSSIDEKINTVDTRLSGEISRVEHKFDSMHQIMTQKQYAQIQDFSSYAEGTLIFTYEEKE
jgi:hypothetical protein